MPVNIDKFGRIDGSRTTIYHVMDYYVERDAPEYIIKWLPLSLEQVHAAFRFIEENKAEVQAKYQKMLDREARGNPQEIEARVAEARRNWFRKKGLEHLIREDGSCASLQEAAEHLKGKALL